MGAPDQIPDLQYQKPDGSLFSRIEMEQQIRDVWLRVYWLRIKANKIYGLPRQTSFAMTEAILRHWVLDEMVRKGQIIGDKVEVSVNSYEDENEKRQFVQRLAAMIHAGQALTPKEGEGVDMSNLPQQPPPPVQSNGQSQFTPPGVPGYGPPPGGFAPPPAPFMPPGIAPPPGMPPAPQQGFAPPPGMPPGVPQQSFAPPQPPGMAMPPGYATPPGMPPGMPGMPQGQPPAAPPAAVAPPPSTTGSGRGRGKKAAADAPMAPAQPPMAAPVPPMGQFAPAAPPQQQQAPAFPQAPSFPSFPQAAPQQQAPQQQAPQQATEVDLTPVLAAIAQLTQAVQQQAQTIAQLQQQVTVLSMGAALTLRAAFQKAGTADMTLALQELGVQVPQ